MRRDPLPWLLLLLLSLLAGLAFLTRDPEHPVLDRLVELPVIGPVAERFRDIYRPPPPRPAEEEPLTELVAVERGAGPQPTQLVTARPLGSVWVRAGTELREKPAAGSAVVETVAQIGTMVLLERRGDWSRVSRVGLHGSLTEGWVHADELGEPSDEELWEPAPVLPLAATALPEEILVEARRLMGDDVRQRPCGPFRLVTDAVGPAVETCPRLAGQLDTLYAERTGLEPVGGPAETILLFDSQGAYLVFRARVSPQSRRDAFAAPGRGFLALAVGGKHDEQVRSMMVHELVHLLNRRFLGPALPSWLDEGLAEELSMSRIAPDGTLVTGSLGFFEFGTGRTRVVGGGQTHLGSLRIDMRRGDLPTLEGLVGLDRAGFQVEERSQIHYALSAFWVRYLLSGEMPSGAEGFRDFLGAVAAGERLEGELLLARLGTGWGELESGFRRWLESSAAAGTGAS